MGQRLSHVAGYSQRMTPAAQIIIAGEAYAVLTLTPAPGRPGEIHAVLDRSPFIDPRKREAVLMLHQGANREPMRLCSPPDGPRLRLRAIY